jgi:hypothetical protein
MRSRNRERGTGRYALTGGLDRVCACGHTLGNHMAERATFNGTTRQECHLCDCECFRVRPSRLDDATFVVVQPASMSQIVCSWRAFVDANESIADEVAEDLRRMRIHRGGGGAAPLFTVRFATAEESERATAREREAADLVREALQSAHAMAQFPYGCGGCERVFETPQDFATQTQAPGLCHGGASVQVLGGVRIWMRNCPGCDGTMGVELEAPADEVTP